MKPFQLEAVLKYRRRLEDIALSSFQEAQLAVQQTKQQVQQTEQEYQELISQAEQLQQQGVMIDELIRYEERMNYSKAILLDLREKLEEQRKHLEKQRDQLVTRSREREIMEKLKEKQNADWQQHLSKKEASMLDEIAVIYHNR